MKKILNFLINLYEESKELFYRESKIISHKSPNDVLSEADLRLNDFFYNRIKNEYKDSNIIIEESENKSLDSNLTFVIDPLDGTCNYSLGLDLCGIQMAVFKDKECVISLIGLPNKDELYYAIKGMGAYLNNKKIEINKDISNDVGILELSDFYQINDDIDLDKQFLLVKKLQLKFLKTRLFGAACIDFTNIASSKAQAYICYYRYIWDIAPGLLLVKESGGVFKRLNENKYEYGNHSIIVANNMKSLDLIIECYKNIK